PYTTLFRSDDFSDRPAAGPVRHRGRHDRNLRRLRSCQWRPRPAGPRHLARPVQHRFRPPDRHPGAGLPPLFPLACRILPAHDGTRGRDPEPPDQPARRHMNFHHHRAHDEPEINLIPLIDVLLVILIFLAASTSFTRHRQLQVALPQAQAQAPDTSPFLELAISRDGLYALDGHFVDAA